MHASDSNPYAAPQSDTSAGILRVGTPGGIWREGSVLVMHKTAELPDRCVKCNAPAHGRRLTRNLSWHPPAWYLLILVSLLIYIIAALVVRHTAKIKIGLCAKHASQRRKRIAVGWLLGLGSIALLAVAGSQGYFSNALVWSWPVALAMFIASIVIAVLVSRLAVPTRIDRHYVWLKNIHPDFLDSLPPAEGSTLAGNLDSAFPALESRFAP